MWDEFGLAHPAIAPYQIPVIVMGAVLALGAVRVEAVAQR
jgi:hypothetical protein